MLNPERLQELENANLGKGYRPEFNEKASAIEWVAYLASEPHAFEPQSVCPILAALLRKWNNDLPLADRNRLLKPILPRLIDTRSTPEILEKRGWMVIDWQVHTWAMEWLCAARCDGQAQVIANCPRVVDIETAITAKNLLGELYNDAFGHWRFVYRPENFESPVRKVQRASGTGLPEFVFEEVMLNCGEVSFFAPDSHSTSSPLWWPPLIRSASNVAWFAAYSMIWPSLEKSNNLEVDAAFILQPTSEALQGTVMGLIDDMINLTMN